MLGFGSRQLSSGSILYRKEPLSYCERLTLRKHRIAKCSAEHPRDSLVLKLERLIMIQTIVDTAWQLLSGRSIFSCVKNSSAVVIHHRF